MPYMYRKRSGIYQTRYRRVGSMRDTITISMRTTNRAIAMKQQGFYNSAVKTFIVNNPDADWSAMREYLRDLAESLLTDKPADFWYSVDVSMIDESREALGDLVATSALSLNQHRAIAQAQDILKAAQVRIQGDVKPLLAIVEEFNQEHNQHPLSQQQAKLPETGRATLILDNEQEGNPLEFTRERQDVLTFDDLYGKFLEETRVNMAKATLSDHNTIRKRLNDYIGFLNMKTYTRDDMTELRASLMESGDYVDASINKILQKLSAVVNWAVNNGLILHNYTKGLKLKGAKSKRRAFTEDEMKSMLNALLIDKNMTLSQQWAIRIGMITGARIGEILQLTKADIKESPEGITYIDINNQNGKVLKNSASIRCVPLTDGAMGFSLGKFRMWLERQRENAPLFKEHSLTHIELNAFIKRHTTGTGEVSFHSLRHYMATKARAKGLTEGDIGGVLGHVSGDITFSIYGATVNLERSQEVLKRTLL